MRLYLDGVALNWPSPTSQDGVASGVADYEATETHHRGTTLTDASRMWPSPRGETAEMWDTPTSRDWKDGANPSENVPTNGLLVCQAVRSLPGPKTTTPGAPSSQSAPSSRRQLNPPFVEWLMGWPVGWTSVAPTASGSRATASFLSRQREPLWSFVGGCTE